jgi:protein associated with RNAse G/E
MKIGDLIHVRACKADGSVYRSWQTMIESVDENLIVTISPAGHIVQDLARGTFAGKRTLRSYYWFDKFYNLLEIFDEQGNWDGTYVNVASPPTFEAGIMYFQDYELDVLKEMDAEAQILDEDEFLEAVVKYGYTQEFQEKVYATAREAIDVVTHWSAKPVPDFGENHVK